MKLLHHRFFCPSFRDSFFIVRKYETNNPNDLAFPSPYSGILFLFNIEGSPNGVIAVASFRPLIRGFFFYFPFPGWTGIS
ncbi:hypothetical protein GCWU000321_00538 [Dialister invisus DSM 15470]|uniref:Uncharacterized protein n=1 Tax=Dialister invisus DSM 15470 TaxID=592028 RepID=C9LM06_9FIRM|nr:hypothetical protein GCWU000321_00538 [Dialister invisus DSM 15470]